jgi:peptide/nickel transport system permease protein
MTGYIGRRLLQSVSVLFGVSVVVFALVHLTGDPVRLLAPIGTSHEELAQLRRAHGLDRPLPEQYLKFIGGVTRGDFGKSLRNQQPALGLVVERLPATLRLAAAAMAIALVVAVPIGILSALRRGSFFDHAGMIIALVGQSMPVFWLGVLLILVFVILIPWFPASGSQGWQSLVLPAITLGMYNMARTTRVLRSELLEVLGQDYVRTARAKGAPEARVVLRHALRNSLIPVVTVLALDLAALLAGSVITEQIFGWPGLGRLAVGAIYARDYPVVQAAVFVVATVYVGLNLATDILYVFLNPQVRLT